MPGLDGTEVAVTNIWDHFSKPLLPQPGRRLPNMEQRPKYQCITEENRKEAALKHKLEGNLRVSRSKLIKNKQTFYGE